MPIDVAMHNPRASVVCAETDGNIVTSCTNANDVALNRVNEVVRAAAGAADDVESVSMQMDGVLKQYDETEIVVKRWRTDRAANGAAGHCELDDLVARELVDRAGGEQVLRGGSTAQDLEKDGNGRLGEGCAVNLELEGCKVEHHVEVDIDIGSTRESNSRRSGVGEGVEVGLEQGGAVGRLGGSGVHVGSASITKDGGVKTTVESSGTDIGVCADPVVVYGLVGVEHERVALSGEDLDAVDGEGLDVDTIGFDNRLLKQSIHDVQLESWLGTHHSMPVNGEGVVGVARS
jgi:hypothetical protein